MNQSNIKRIGGHEMWTNFLLETKGYVAIEHSKNRRTCLIPIEHSNIWRYDQNVYWKPRVWACVSMLERRDLGSGNYK